MSAFTSMGTKPNVNIGVSERSRRSESIWDNTLGWVLEHSKSNAFLSQQMESMLDKNLPDRIVNLVDDDDENTDSTFASENTDCIKVLLCKTGPFIRSMQKAVSAQMNESEENETEEPPSEEKKDDSADDDRLKPFFKYLPSLEEFKKHGVKCERQFKGCKIF